MDAQTREDLRHAALKILAARFPAGVTSARVRRIALPEFGDELAEADVDGALELLRGLGFAGYSQDEMGSTKYWSATSAGVLHNERGSAAKPPRHD